MKRFRVILLSEEDWQVVTQLLAAFGLTLLSEARAPEGIFDFTVEYPEEDGLWAFVVKLTETPGVISTWTSPIV